MSESRFSGESRSYVSPSYQNYSSESRCSESRSSESRISYPTYPSCTSESRCISESRPMSKASSQPKYNNLDDVDKLIERLETSLPTEKSTSERYNQALAKRKQQIEELKSLRDQARQKIEEDKLLSALEEQNLEIASAINGVKKLLKKPSPYQPKKSPSCSSYYYDSSESHDSGESRW